MAMKARIVSDCISKIRGRVFLGRSILFKSGFGFFNLIGLSRDIRNPCLGEVKIMIGPWSSCVYIFIKLFNLFVEHLLFLCQALDIADPMYAVAKM